MKLVLLSSVFISMEVQYIWSLLYKFSIRTFAKWTFPRVVTLPILSLSRQFYYSRSVCLYFIAIFSQTTESKKTNLEPSVHSVSLINFEFYYPVKFSVCLPSFFLWYRYISISIHQTRHREFLLYYSLVVFTSHLSIDKFLPLAFEVWEQSFLY